MPQRSLIHRLGRLARDTDQARTLGIRGVAFSLMSRATPLVGVERDGVRYVVSTRERAGVGHTTFLTGAFDEETLRRTIAALREHLSVESLVGLTVLEVGANIGTETVSFIKRHGVERVIAFEPDAENARLLRANVALNGLHDRVEIFEIALSDVDATLLLETSEENWGDHRIRVTEPQGPDLRDEGRRPTVEVEARRIDSLDADGTIDLGAVGLVWMDAQGHEGHVLAGAARIADHGIPILTEYWPYGLRRAGGLERFHSYVSERFDRVVDLRTGYREAPVVVAAADVSQLEDRYVRDERGDPFNPHTDLLLVPRSTTSD